jgi:hypothetical protein
VPPPDITRRGAIGNQDRRRSYDEGREQCEDALLGATIPWSPNRPFHELLGAAIERLFLRNVSTILAE